MSIAMREEQLLNDTLAAVDSATSHRGEISPSAVISIIDNLTLDLEIGFYELPQELQLLRTEAEGRRKMGEVGFQEAYVADKIVMCGLWAW